MAHDQEIMGSNPGTVYWMDVSDASYYIIEKLKIKVAKWGTPKKYLKKRMFVISCLFLNVLMTRPDTNLNNISLSMFVITISQ